MGKPEDRPSIQPRAGSNMLHELTSRISYNLKEPDINKEFLTPLISEIDNWFSVKNEYESYLRLGKRGLDADKFLREQATKYILEFTTKIPYTRLSLDWESGILKFANVSVLEHYKKAEGKGGRAEAELKGIERLIDNFRNGASISIILSPPWVGDYSFAFIFERRGNEVVEHIVRYDEDFRSFEGSKEIWNELLNLGFFPFQENHNNNGAHPENLSKNDFVSTPLSYWKNNPLEETDAVLRRIISMILGVGGEENGEIGKKLALYYDLESKLSRELKPYLDEYVKFLKEGNLDAAKYEIALIYFYGNQLSQQFWEEGLESKITPLIRDNFIARTPRELAQQLRMKGGSCPVLNSDLFGLPSLLEGRIITPRLATKEGDTKIVVCPRCGGRFVYAGNGVVVCPYCSFKFGNSKQPQSRY